MKKSIVSALPICAALAIAATSVAAQTPDAALDEAKRRLACGAGTPVSAEYLPNGSIRVSCRAPGTEAVATAQPTLLEGTGLAATPAAAAIGAIVILAILVGDDDDSTTTTTTSTSASR